MSGVAGLSLGGGSGVPGRLAQGSGVSSVTPGPPPVPPIEVLGEASGPPEVSGISGMAYASDAGSRTLFVVSAGSGTLAALDILSDPSAPMFISEIGGGTEFASGSQMAISPNRQYAYVAFPSEQAIKVVDVSDPTNMSVVRTVTEPSTVDIGSFGMVAQGNYLYASSSSGIMNGSIAVFDISDPSLPVYAPSLTTTVTGSIETNPVTLPGGTVFTTGVADAGGFPSSQAFSLDPPNILDALAMPVGLSPQAQEIYGSSLMIGASNATGDQFLLLIDTTNPASLTSVVAAGPSFGTLGGGAVVGVGSQAIVFVNTPTYDIFAVRYDISNRSAPAYIDTVLVRSMALLLSRTVTAVGGLIYLPVYSLA